MIKWTEVLQNSISILIYPGGFATTISRPRGHKTFFMLNSAEHEIFHAHKFFKMPTETVVGILTFVCRKNSIIGVSVSEKS